MIYIWIRSTLHWKDEAAFRAQLNADLLDKVECWNRTFRIPYHLFRYRLREISRLNFSRVEGATCVEWEGIPDGGLVVPVDDDDWFAPDLAHTLTSVRDANYSAYLWPGHFLEVPVHLRHEIGRFRRKLLPSTPSRHLCITNNYAMVKGANTRVLLENHVRASHWFESRLGSAVKEIGDPLSIMNRTLGSITSLRDKNPPFVREKLLLRYYRYRRLYRRRVGPGLSWSQPYRDMMRVLIQELR